MIRGIILLLVFQLLGLQYSFALTAKTIGGNCNSSDKTKHFKTKTYIDTDDDGKDDYVVTRWCNDKITTTKLKIIFPNGPIDFNPSAIPIHQLDYVNFDEDDCQFGFLLREESDGPIIAVEQKPLDSDTCYLYVLLDSYFRALDPLEQKIYPMILFNERNQTYIVEVYLKDTQEGRIILEDMEGNNIKEIVFNGKVGWNLLFFKRPNSLKADEYFLKVKTTDVNHLLPIRID